MRFDKVIIMICLLCAGIFAAPAQPFRPKAPPAQSPTGLNFSGSLSTLFKDQQYFSASLTMQVAKQFGATMSVPCKMTYTEGKSRIESDFNQAKGIDSSPEMVEQIKSSGMGKTIVITRPLEHKTFTIYPELYSYVERREANTFDPTRVLTKVDEIGKETIGGQPCIKKTIKMAAPRSMPEEFTVWNATELKNFPLRIEMIRSGAKVTLLFTNVVFEKPDTKLFEPPPDYVGFESVSSMLEKQARKKK
ncbi:MAG TPA: hypothetical protein VMZ27_02460 [Candidatus Saccharimonadales bacterium]|nr:hypothetical protein [Candidatus Saccharimonadales bacterium]